MVERFLLPPSPVRNAAVLYIHWLLIQQLDRMYAVVKDVSTCMHIYTLDSSPRSPKKTLHDPRHKGEQRAVLAVVMP